MSHDANYMHIHGPSLYIYQLLACPVICNNLIRYVKLCKLRKKNLVRKIVAKNFWRKD